MDYPESTFFEWDPAKAESNRRKHGVSFEKARALMERGACVFVEFDADHSEEEEERCLAYGILDGGLIRVVFTRPEDEVVRILGARKATRRERARHERLWRGMTP